MFSCLKKNMSSRSHVLTQKHVLMFSCHNKKHVLMFSCLKKNMSPRSLVLKKLAKRQ